MQLIFGVGSDFIAAQKDAPSSSQKRLGSDSNNIIPREMNVGECASNKVTLQVI